MSGWKWVLWCDRLEGYMSEEEGDSIQTKCPKTKVAIVYSSEMRV